MMVCLKKTAALILSLVMCLGMVNALAFTPEREALLYEASLELLKYIQEGDEEAALDMMDEAMRGAMAGQVAGMWAQLAALGGEFEGAGAYLAMEEDGLEIILLELRFANVSLIQRAVFDAQGKVSGLFFSPGSLTKEEELGLEGAEEITLEVDAGEGYPLDALLALPQGEIKAGLVMVQGSGSSDKNESLGPNAPFRDLAQGLALQGIATLRYDKRTYSYGAKMVQSPDYAQMTVDQETVNDAVAALKLLRERPELEGKPIYLLGHSLGAMLSSYIGSKSGENDGYILLAGSPRKLWELSEEQNLLGAAELEAAGDTQNAQMVHEIVATEREKALNMEKLEAGETVFGLPLPYQLHLEGIDAAALHRKDQKPVLVLQGEKDRQVTMKDFELWKEKLADHPAAEFISYPNLNHLFGDYQGEEVPLSQLVMVEYASRTPLDPQVIEDIASFILGK